MKIDNDDHIKDDDDDEDIKHDGDGGEHRDRSSVSQMLIKQTNNKEGRANKPSNFAATKAIPGSDIASANIWSWIATPPNVT